MARPSTRALVLCLCCVLAAAQNITLTEAALDPTGQCVPKTTLLCNGIAGLAPGSVIYVNGTFPESLLASTAQPLYDQLQLLKTLGFESCLEAISQLFCLSVFQPCSQFQLDNVTVVALPSQPCRNICDYARTLCERPFSTYGVVFPTCPPESITWDFRASGQQPFVANCSTTITSSVAVEPVCIPVHEFFLGEKLSRNLYTLSIVLGWIGFILNTAIFLLYLLNPILRKWPIHCVIALAASQAVFAFGLVMSTFVDRRDLLCKGGDAVFIVIGIHFAIGFWMILTVATMLVLVQRDPRRLQRWFDANWYWTFLYLLVPLAFCIGAFTNIGPNQAMVFCITLNQPTTEHFILWPVVGEMFIGTICWCITLFVLAKNLFTKANWKRDVVVYLRVLLYEVAALFPSSILIVPWAVLRERITNRDISVFTDGSGKRTLTLITIGACLTPIVFAAVFMIKKEHWEFVNGKIRTLVSTSTTQSGGASGSRSPKSGSGEEENAEISKF